MLDPTHGGRSWVGSLRRFSVLAPAVRDRANLNACIQSSVPCAQTGNRSFVLPIRWSRLPPLKNVLLLETGRIGPWSTIQAGERPATLTSARRVLLTHRPKYQEAPHASPTRVDQARSLGCGHG